MSAITMNFAEFATKVAEVIANLKRDDELLLTGERNEIVAKVIPAGTKRGSILAPSRCCIRT